MQKVMAAIFSLFFVLASFGFSMAADQDEKGGKDHPLLSRMPDFHVSNYKDTEFNSHRFIDHDKKPVSVEGHKYYIEYRLNKGAAEPGELKIRRNIQDALKKIGGKVVFDDNFNKVSTIVVQKEAKETWVEVRAYNNMYRLTIVEKEVMKQEVVADAAAMGNDINTTGHVPVYGIYFDTGKSEIKPESDAAISEIATLLKNNGTLNIYVVGHTDNVGSFDSNMKLSKDRADAVAKALTSQYGIAVSRLKSYGVASLSPVASNDTEDGKAKNRRVELVKQ
ncbi:MAG: OmpA family protein [Thermodesulfovibrionales bacterium]|nr:OmpA family protein [Thermodesulfovibrionales bacterium]